MHIVIAADHRGFELKKHLKVHLVSQNHTVEDMGNFSLVPDDDYPDFVYPLVQKIKERPEAYGIVCCASGVGVSIAANRFEHIRCGLCFSETHVVSARRDDNINVLAVPAVYESIDAVYSMVTLFLSTAFDTNPRYARRLQKINDYAHLSHNPRGNS